MSSLGAAPLAEAVGGSRWGTGDDRYGIVSTAKHSHSVGSQTGVHEFQLLGGGMGVDDAGAGVVAAFDGFYRCACRGQLERALLFLGGLGAAEDAVHEAFVLVYRRWKAIEDPGPI